MKRWAVRWIGGVMIGLLVACGAARSPTVPSSVSPTLAEQLAEAGWQPVLQAPAQFTHMPLAPGTTWVYHVVNEDDCAKQEGTRQTPGMITETITSAWHDGDVYVFVLNVTSELYGYTSTHEAAYVLVGDALYRAAGSAALALAQARGEGFDNSLAFRPKPAEKTTLGAWKVIGQEPVAWEGGTQADCFHLQRRTSANELHHWFCPGIGFVKRQEVSAGPIAHVQTQTLIKLERVANVSP